MRDDLEFSDFEEHTHYYCSMDSCDVDDDRPARKLQICLRFLSLLENATTSEIELAKFENIKQTLDALR